VQHTGDLSFAIVLDPSLTAFRHVVARPDDELDLAVGALLVSEAARREPADIEATVAALDRLAGEARGTVAPNVVAIAHWLHRVAGFRGNRDDYYDPRNSFLDEVLARKTGIPITLSIVVMEVARRIGAPAFGISFPGHFLVATAAEGEGRAIVDAFEGVAVGKAALRALLQRTTGEAREPDPALLQPATKRQILARMLTNLRGIYASRGDRPTHERIAAYLDAVERASGKPRGDAAPVVS
jgi:regulator of sirC expression with transglutaminase-like and TPR domain